MKDRFAPSLRLVALAGAVAAPCAPGADPRAPGADARAPGADVRAPGAENNFSRAPDTMSTTFTRSCACISIQTRPVSSGKLSQASLPLRGGI